MTSMTSAQDSSPTPSDGRPDHAASSPLTEIATQAARAAGRPSDSRVEAPRPWVWGRVKDISLAILGVAGVLYVAAQALQWFTAVVLLFVLAALLAFILQPVVGALEARLGLSRTAAAGIAYVAVAIALGIAAFWGVSKLIDEVTTVIANLPASHQAAHDRTPDLQARA